MVDKAYDFLDGEDLHAILIPGDFNEHSLPGRTMEEGTPNDQWPQMQRTFRAVVQTLALKFPGVPILPAIGNNDCYYHDMAPNTTATIDEPDATYAEWYYGNLS